MSVRLPDQVSLRLLRQLKRPLNAARAPEAFEVLQMPVRYGSFDSLNGKYALLVTYKRDGTAVPTPVWFARDGQSLYVWTEINAYKAKRLRNDGRALLAPCTARGVPTGNPIAAQGRLLTDERERRRAAVTIRKSWGMSRRVLERISRPVTDVHYLAFVPVTPEAGGLRPTEPIAVRVTRARRRISRQGPDSAPTAGKTKVGSGRAPEPRRSPSHP